MKILLATSIITCTLLTGCWSVRTQKELLITDDLNQPVENAEIYIIWHGAPILFGETDGEKRDKKEVLSYSFRSNKDGIIHTDFKLVWPRDYNFFITKKGYYPTVVPIKTNQKNITLLNKKRINCKITEQNNRKTTFYNSYISLSGITYEQFGLIHFYDYANRMKKIDPLNLSENFSKQKNKYIKLDKYNCYNIYKSQSESDGVFIQDDPQNAYFIKNKQ